MSNLDPQADKAVHDAVDAFMEGRLNPEFAGETVFETKNSRYRLLDGVVFAAPDDGLIGAELVGWLMETTRRSVVGSAWQPGARAVLVDRHRGRSIIVTSTTRLLHLEHAPGDPSAMAQPHRPVAPMAPMPPQGWMPPPPEPPPQRPRIIPSTPPPPQVVGPPPQRFAPPQGPSPVQSAASLQKRAAAVHLPPRPIVPATPLPLPVRPLPAPAPPPRREVLYDGAARPDPRPPAQFHPPQPQVDLSPEPAGGTPWELTSSEFELEGENTQPGHDQAIPLHYDASHHRDTDSTDASTDEFLSGPESGTDAPIPLTRPSNRSRF